MKLTLKIWRQAGPEAKGKIVTYPIDGIDGDMSFLEMMDILNENLINKGEVPVEFDHDCREGICGSCNMMINGQPHGAYVSVNTSGNTQDANSIPIEKAKADEAFHSATCIGCGACVAACKNASAMLFTSAKVSQYALLPQGEIEATDRVMNMVRQMDIEGFGNCTNTGACMLECPKGIKLENIARMNREYLKAEIIK